MCNKPANYAVEKAEGLIVASKCTDLVIRHVAVSPKTVGKTDKFRLTIFHAETKQEMARKDVLSTLHEGTL